MRRFLVLTALTAGLLAGCGGATPTPAGPASEEDKERDLADQKRVEQEERGKPIKPARKK